MHRNDGIFRGYFTWFLWKENVPRVEPWHRINFIVITKQLAGNIIMKFFNYIITCNGFNLSKNFRWHRQDRPFHLPQPMTELGCLRRGMSNNQRAYLVAHHWLRSPVGDLICRWTIEGNVPRHSWETGLGNGLTTARLSLFLFGCRLSGRESAADVFLLHDFGFW